METITTQQIVDGDNTRLLINAIASLYDRDSEGAKLADKIFKHGEANGGNHTVQLIVDGVELPVLETIQDFINYLEKEFDTICQEKIMEKLKGSKLQKLIDLLDSVEWQIESEVQNLFKS